MPRTNTILIAEYNPFIQELIVDLLADEGYDTRSVSNGLDVLAIMAVDQPALLLFDMALPDLSAAQLLDWMANQNVQHVRVLLMTTIPGRASPLLVPGLVECVAKPFDLVTILTKVAQLTPSA